MWEKKSQSWEAEKKSKILGSGRACGKRKVSLGKRKSKKERKVKLWATEEHVEKEKLFLGAVEQKGKNYNLGQQKSN
jgi:hypothetical protein